jgi:hypothetical protein
MQQIWTKHHVSAKPVKCVITFIKNGRKISRYQRGNQKPQNKESCYLEGKTEKSQTLKGKISGLQRGSSELETNRNLSCG